MRQFAVIALLAGLLTGCASIHSTAEGVLGGGLVGAGVGAAAAAASGGAVGTGALIGGLVGAAGGGYVGCQNEAGADRPRFHRRSERAAMAPPCFASSLEDQSVAPRYSRRQWRDSRDR
jgi:hypothetical protein